jgi:putative acetyltransferase
MYEPLLMHITPDDLSGPEIRALLEQHFAGMLANSPEDSCHFLDFDGLKGPGVTFWSVWTQDEDGRDQLAGCGALRELDPTHGEIKSMRTADPFLRRGAGAAILTHIIDTARERGYTRLSLETGSGAAFEAAQSLYRRLGFAPCGPFGSYVENPFSRYFTLVL